MNRAERRAKGIKGKEPIINIKVSDLEKAKEDAEKKAIDRAFILMLGLPTMVIHDKFSTLIKVKNENIPREQRFCEAVLDLYDDFQKGYFTLTDVQNALLEEAGVDTTHLRK